MLSSRLQLIRADDGHALPAAPDGAVLESSVDLGWRGLTVERHRMPPMEMPEHFVQGHRLIAIDHRPVAFEWREGKVWRRKVFEPGSFAMQPHGDFNAPRWFEPFEFLAIALEPEFVESAFREAVPADRLRFAERRGEFDPLVARLAEEFRRELQSPRYRGALYGESLALALASHLLERHGVGRPVVPKGRLSGEQMRAVLALLHERLSDDLSLEELAEAAHLSPFHFARLFKSSLSLAPHQYLMRLRIERARRLLVVAPRESLTTLGLGLGFSDAAHFANAFRRAVGVSPSAYARQAV
jgi:AraC family transcriptional regulator